VILDELRVFISFLKGNAPETAVQRPLWGTLLLASIQIQERPRKGAWFTSLLVTAASASQGHGASRRVGTVACLHPPDSPATWCELTLPLFSVLREQWLSIASLWFHMYIWKPQCDTSQTLLRHNLITANVNFVGIRGQLRKKPQSPPLSQYCLIERLPHFQKQTFHYHDPFKNYHETLEWI
jgi:hypothetical protein